MIMIIASVIAGTAYMCWKIHKQCAICKEHIFYMMFLNTICIFGLGISVNMIMYNAVSFTSLGGAVGLLTAGICNAYIFKEEQIIKISTVSLPLIYSISKIGCLLAGCCGGGIVVMQKTIPVQLIETIVFFIIFAVFHINYERISVAAMITICCICKMLLDFLRQSHEDTFLTKNQIGCLIILILTIIIENRRKASKLRGK